MTDTAGSLYRVANLTFGYQSDKPVIVNATFILQKSEITILSGENGSGKTTLCRLPMGLNRKYEGSIILNDFEVKTSRERQISDLIVLISQGTIGNVIGINFDEDLEIWQNRFMRKDCPESAKSRQKSLSCFDILEIAHDPIWNLSVGQKKGGVLAALPLFPGKYWILDEPIASLDSDKCQRFFQLVQRKRDNGCGALIITHQPDLFSNISDRHFVLKKGQVIDTNAGSNVCL